MKKRLFQWAARPLPNNLQVVLGTLYGCSELFGWKATNRKLQILKSEVRKNARRTNPNR